MYNELELELELDFFECFFFLKNFNSTLNRRNTTEMKRTDGLSWKNLKGNHFGIVVMSQTEPNM